MGLEEEIARLDALAAAEEGKKPEDEAGDDTLAGDDEGEDTNEGGEDTTEGGEGDGKKPAAAAPAAKTPDEEAAAAAAAKAAAPALDPNDEKNPASVYYKLRVAQRDKEKLEAQLEEAKKPAAGAIPDANEDPEGHLAARLAAQEAVVNDLLGYVGQDLAAKKEEQQLESAFTALSSFEEKLKTTRPDYDAARDHLSRVYAEEFMLHNPNLKGKPLIAAVAKQIIAVADAASQRGIDPAAFLLSRAEAMGYRKEAAPAVGADGKPPAKAEEKRPNLAKVAENKKKSSGMPRSNGGVAELTNEAVMEMSNAERAKLTPSDWARLEAAGA